MGKNKKSYDVVIIGAGVVGCAIALELSKYNILVGLLEKNHDVGQETSSRNSGVIHAGFNYTPGCLRGKLDVEGNELLHTLSKKLNVDMFNIGKLTVAKDEEDIKTLNRLLEQGKANNVPNLRLIDIDEMCAIQPGVSGVKALHSPSSSIINPYYLTIAMAETAKYNGVDICLGTCVEEIIKTEQGFITNTNKGKIVSKVVINSAGLRADKICSMLGINEYKIYPCKGEYWILDRAKSDFLRCLIYPTPRKNEPGLGIHLTPTTRGNIMIGPSAEYTNCNDDYCCSSAVLKTLAKEGQGLIDNLKPSDFIRHFSGLRPKLAPPEVGGNMDFVIEDRKDVKGFICLVGIESPGLTSSPAIANMVRDMVKNHIVLKKKDKWSYKTIKNKKYRDMSIDERIEAIRSDANYGDIVCRCEQVTRKEIIDAYNNPLGAKSLRSIKMRTGAMMGRCQSGFCMSKIISVLKEEFSVLPEDISFTGTSTKILETLRK